ncbi:MAG: hypothetical protein BGO41_01245 [Clostridiales bacterium 38-18]|nr:MAG: hypothetical protein BGO41_01245 [Clostridiales bacterium 38-18]
MIMLVVGGFIGLLFLTIGSILSIVIELINGLLITPPYILNDLPYIGYFITFVRAVALIYLVVNAIRKLVEIGEYRNEKIETFFIKLMFGILGIAATPFLIKFIFLPFNYYVMNAILFITKQTTNTNLIDTSIFGLSDFLNERNSFDIVKDIGDTLSLLIKQLVLMCVTLFFFIKITFIGGKRAGFIIIMYLVGPLSASSLVIDSKAIGSWLTECFIWAISGMFMLIFIFLGIEFLTLGMDFKSGRTLAYQLVLGIALLDISTRPDDLIRPFVYAKIGMTNSRDMNTDANVLNTLF